MLNPIGLKNGKLIHISNLSEIERGSKCECVCPQCGKNLIARMGEKNIWHFAHEAEVKCDFGLGGSDGESPIHRYAKQIILEYKSVRIDEATLVNFVAMEEEHREGDTILDILGVVEDSQELGIEIYYKHKVDSEKLEKLKARYKNVLEIDIPALVEQDLMNDKEFRRKVIHEYPRTLIINNGFENNLKYRLDIVKHEEARIRKESEEVLKTVAKRKNFIDREEFRLNQKITYVSNLKDSVKHYEDLQILKKREFEDLSEEIERARKELEEIENNKKHIYEKTKQDLKTKEIELNLREHKLDRVEQENIKLKQKIKEVLNKEIDLRAKEEDLRNKEKILDSRKEEQESYYKHKRQTLDSRAEELDEMGRNLVKINKKKWLQELSEKRVINNYDLKELL